MKTLILNGSPRKNGDTMTLIKELMAHINGEVKLVHAYDSNIKPCVDCRYCKKNRGCVQKDGMQEIYDYVEACDNIVIASPIYFATLTAPLLSLASRFQTYFYSIYLRKEKVFDKEKKGGIILTGGGTGGLKNATLTAKILAHELNAKNLAPLVTSTKTDTLPCKEDAKALEKARELAYFLNEE